MNDPQPNVTEVARQVGPDWVARELSDFGAFVPGPRFELQGATTGPLGGLRVAVKDVFDIAGTVTGAGNPDWAIGRLPAVQTAAAVQGLLDAGARIIGKTVTDEITLGLLGRNRHDGTPVNPRAPDRMPGGSSSGSAVAVAAELADLGLGTDSGGSVRAPASFLGLWGMRPTHRAVSVAGLLVQSPSFDTAGLLARDIDALEAGMSTLLPKDSAPLGGLVLAEDVLSEADQEIQKGMLDLLSQGILRDTEAISIAEPEGLSAWAEISGTAQAAEFASAFAPWLDAADPRLSWGVARALVAGLNLTKDEIQAARHARKRVAASVDKALGNQAVLIPTTPCPAPPRNLPHSELARVDRRLVRSLCIAGLTGRPQVSMPLLASGGLPVGLSILGPRGSDRGLLRLASALAQHLPQ